VDEKSQIQALDRTAPILPLRPGVPERPTHDYKRHGTPTLLAAFHILHGKVLGTCQPRHRRREFIRFLNHLELGWLDQIGHPRSEKLHVTERFRRVDFGHIQLQIAFDDPETLAKPLTISLPMNYLADTDTLESVCNENERDRAHFVAGELKPKIRLSPAALVKYAGT
jgi:hypothetical protein